MSKQKDCAFQYYANGKMIEDTDLITKEEGIKLIEKYKEDFINHCEKGNTAEMALWIEMSSSHNYHKTYLHVRTADDLIIKHGELYELKRVFT
jgi:hypothetical protein